jgi:aspartate aminotransferase-like enzyme
MKNNPNVLKNFINLKNKKIVFTPGPGSLSVENLKGLAPYFGRGDKDYAKIEKFVINRLKKISGQNQVVTFQGSGSLAIEIAIQNFLYGKVLLIKTGYYSDRVKSILDCIKNEFRKIKKVDTISWTSISKVKNRYDWICACPVETSIGLKIPIKQLHKLKKKTKSKLMLDATGSMGLENNHKLADLCTFSSCKGLFGLTGASFVSYKSKPNNKVKSFYMDINTHINKKITGPYHSIGSLFYVMKNYENMKKAVLSNKKKFLNKFKNYLVHSEENQPNLCTYVDYKIKTKNRNVVLYKSRKKINGSVVSHLGEIHLKNKSEGKIIKNLS